VPKQPTARSSETELPTGGAATVHALPFHSSMFWYPLLIPAAQRLAEKHPIASSTDVIEVGFVITDQAAPFQRSVSGPLLPPTAKHVVADGHATP